MVKGVQLFVHVLLRGRNKLLVGAYLGDLGHILGRRVKPLAVVVILCHHLSLTVSSFDNSSSSALMISSRRTLSSSRAISIRSLSSSAKSKSFMPASASYPLDPRPWT